MEENLNYGVILRQLRVLQRLSVQEFGRKIGKSAGWVSEVENGSGESRLPDAELNRIVDLLGAGRHREMFRTWVANYKNAGRVDHTFDGAVLKFIRVKKEVRLADAAKKAGFSIAHLSQLERGMKEITLDVRNRLMSAYGYSPSSWKNLATDPVRSKAVPIAFKLKILLGHMDDAQIAAVYEFSRSLISRDARADSASAPSTLTQAKSAGRKS